MRARRYLNDGALQAMKNSAAKKSKKKNIRTEVRFRGGRPDPTLPLLKNSYETLRCVICRPYVIEPTESPPAAASLLSITVKDTKGHPNDGRVA